MLHGRTAACVGTIARDAVGPPTWLMDSYNVAPTQQVPIVRMHDGEREDVVVRWGLVPFFAKGEPGKFSTINARVETLETAA